MNICIFGAASDRIDDVYKKTVENLGYQLALNGHTLVFGGGAEGLMGAAARGFEKGNGKIIGVIPDFFMDTGFEIAFKNCTELIETPDMSTRKTTMEKLADAYIITPGGIGTFDEYFEVLTDKQLGRHGKPIVVYNIEHYFDELEDVIKTAMDKGFIRPVCAELYACVDTPEQITDYLDNYTPPDGSHVLYKRGPEK